MGLNIDKALFTIVMTGTDHTVVSRLVFSTLQGVLFIHPSVFHFQTVAIIYMNMWPASVSNKRSKSFLLMISTPDGIMLFWDLDTCYKLHAVYS